MFCTSFQGRILHRTPMRLPDQGNFDFQRTLCSRITLLLMLPRVISKRLRSDDQLKSNIWSEVNFVNCLGSPPASGCSQTFVTSSRVSKYSRRLLAGWRARNRRWGRLLDYLAVASERLAGTHLATVIQANREASHPTFASNSARGGATT